MELYNFQQQLAKMQMQLEIAQERFAHTSQIRLQAEEQLQRLQQSHAEEEQLTAQERLKVSFVAGHWLITSLTVHACICLASTAVDDAVITITRNHLK